MKLNNRSHIGKKSTETIIFSLSFFLFLFYSTHFCCGKTLIRFTLQELLVVLVVLHCLCSTIIYSYLDGPRPLAPSTILICPSCQIAIKTPVVTICRVDQMDGGGNFELSLSKVAYLLTFRNVVFESGNR